MTTVTGSDGKVYTMEGGTLTVTGTGAITAISNWTVDSTTGFSGAKRLIIGEGITQVNSNYAFAFNASLEYVQLPSTLTKVTSYAFRDCTKLASLILPASLSTINYMAFANCTKLTSIVCKQTSAPYMDVDSFKDVGTTASPTTVNIYSSGWASTAFTTTQVGSSATLNFINQVPYDYRHILLGGDRVQVDSAIRDEDGLRIKTGYQKKLTFDSAPTANSTNPVTSGGIYSKLDYAACQWVGYFAGYNYILVKDMASGHIIGQMNVQKWIQNGDHIKVSDTNPNSLGGNVTLGLDFGSANAGKFLKVASDGKPAFESNSLSITTYQAVDR